ncbi:hypothetical protein ABZ281_14390 [Streptomyces sp. NPDC006265]|uniref:hypothetical protein n=1 Tax=Streptomyces sp. NPDC006265 TaxID=3156740 RepID=UPI0033A69048
MTAAAALASLGIFAAQPANAAEVCGAGTSGALVCFYADGDIIKVKDTVADGHRAVANWYTNYGRSGTCENTSGKGTWVTCNYDLREDGHITYRAEVREGKTLIRKSAWVTSSIAGCPSGMVCSG